MPASVHISVDDEIDIAGFRDPDDLDPVIIVIVSLVRVLRDQMECKDRGELFGRLIVLPQRIVRHKSDDVGLRVGHILNIFLVHTEEYARRADRSAAAVIDLDRLPLKIEKHDTVIEIAHAVEFPDMVIFCTVIFPDGTDDIVVDDRAGRLIDLPDLRDRLVIDLRIETSPCHLIKRRPDVHRRIRIVRDGRVGLKICVQLPCIGLVKACLIEMIDKVHIFLSEKIGALEKS